MSGSDDLRWGREPLKGVIKDQIPIFAGGFHCSVCCLKRDGPESCDI